ncbi:MAG: hypothetical protein WC980_06820 [Candidatus Brocadiia bacterium]
MGNGTGHLKLDKKQKMWLIKQGEQLSIIDAFSCSGLIMEEYKDSKIEAHQKKLSLKKVTKGGLGCLGIIIALIALMILGSWLQEKDKDAEKDSGTSSVTSHKKPTIKNAKVLYSEGATLLNVAIDEKAFDDYCNVLAVEDKYGYEELILSGRIFSVENNIEVLVLKGGFFKSKVRILEGKSIGMSGWVENEWLND